MPPSLRQMGKITTSTRRRFFTPNQILDDYAMVDKPYGMVYARCQSELSFKRRSQHRLWLRQVLSIVPV
jgi:hypothetical protein